MPFVDSGFDGYLVVPEWAARELGRPDGRRRVRTASGQTVRVDWYLGEVQVIGVSVPAQALALGDEYIVGLRVLNHFRAILDHGVGVTIEP